MKLNRRKWGLAARFACILISGMLLCGCGLTNTDVNENSVSSERATVKEQSKNAKEEKKAKEEKNTKEQKKTEQTEKASKSSETSSDSESSGGLLGDLFGKKQDKEDENGFETIKFGHYEQDNDTTNGAEEVEWLVLKKEGDRILLISRYALDYQKYNVVQNSLSNLQTLDVTWETCDIRGWLNDSFYNTAFTNEEQGKILTVTNTNPDASGFDKSWKKGKGGNDTIDRVFYLSYEEALAYFETDEARRCMPTAYAEAQGVKVREIEDDNTFGCTWELRSPGNHQSDVMRVYYDGHLTYGGASNHLVAVRPAIWISIK